MASTTENRPGSWLTWALITPLILACGLLFFPLIPALCVFLDSRSRTYTGAVTVLAGSALLSVLLGPGFASIFTFVAIATAGAYVLVRVKVPFRVGLLGSAGAGVLGAVALLGVLGLALGKSINVVFAAYFCNGLSSLSTSGYPEFLNMLATVFNPNQQATGTMSFFVTVPQQIASMSVPDKINIVRPVLEDFFSQEIPAWALAGGMLTGGLAYYLPVLAADRLSPKTSEDKPAAVEVPPLYTVRFPKYIIVSILLLQLVSYFGMDNTALATLYVASNMILTVLMTIQSLALFSFLLTRRKVPPVLQFLILAVVTVLFSWWLLEYVGLFDVLFDLRAVVLRVEMLKAKGKQVFTPGGLDELRRMGGNGTKDGKKDKDGEENKK